MDNASAPVLREDTALAPIYALERERRRADAAFEVARRAKLADEELLPFARARLDAWREWGIALGPAGRGGDTSSASDRLSDAEYKQRERARKIALVPDDKFEEYKLVDEPDKLTLAGLLKTAHIAHNSGDNEWYTPPEYIAAAIDVMGGVDLDPASSVTANQIVGAARFFAEADDGLRQEWSGRVWMNPPYARPLIDQFAAKLAESYADGFVTEACVLVNNATETGWFHALAEVAAALCFPRQRVKFWHPEKESAPLQGQAVIYLGAAPDVFRGRFVEFGFTAQL